jgi:L-asparaginase II
VAAVGVDGCGAPLFAASLTGLARAFQALVTAAPGSVERTVADAMRAHPELVAGTGAAAGDTRLMAGVPGLLAKHGAEGVAAVAVPEVGAVALKIDDGAARARLPVLVSALRRLGVAAPVLDELAGTPVLGGGEPVGAVRPLW